MCMCVYVCVYMYVCMCMVVWEQHFNSVFKRSLKELSLCKRSNSLSAQRAVLYASPHPESNKSVGRDQAQTAQASAAVGIYRSSLLQQSITRIGTQQSKGC